jgi:hypothetical protein
VLGLWSGFSVCLLSALVVGVAGVGLVFENCIVDAGIFLFFCVGVVWQVF